MRIFKPNVYFKVLGASSLIAFCTASSDALSGMSSEKSCAMLLAQKNKTQKKTMRIFISLW